MNTLDLINATGHLITISFPVAGGIALLVYFWGLAKFIFHIGGAETAVEEGKRIMKWGIIALFVLVSVWGIVVMIQNNLLPGGSTINPTVPTPPPTPDPSGWGPYL